MTLELLMTRPVPQQEWLLLWWTRNRRRRQNRRARAAAPPAAATKASREAFAAAKGKGPEQASKAKQAISRALDDNADADWLEVAAQARADQKAAALTPDAMEKRKSRRQTPAEQFGLIKKL